jgi:hypothetical protein
VPQEGYACDGVRGYIRAKGEIVQVSKDWEVGLKNVREVFFLFCKKKQGLGETIGNSIIISPVSSSSPRRISTLEIVDLSVNQLIESIPNEVWQMP